MSSIKFDYRTQSNSIDAIGSILFGRKTKWYTKLISIITLSRIGRNSLFNLVLTRGASVRDFNT